MGSESLELKISFNLKKKKKVNHCLFHNDQWLVERVAEENRKAQGVLIQTTGHTSQKVNNLPTVRHSH